MRWNSLDDLPGQERRDLRVGQDYAVMLVERDSMTERTTIQSHDVRMDNNPQAHHMLMPGVYDLELRIVHGRGLWPMSQRALAYRIHVPPANEDNANFTVALIADGLPIRA
jgi:hypothetical protein